MIFVKPLIYEIKEDNWGTRIFTFQICWDDQILQGGWIPTMWEDVCLPFEPGRKNILSGSEHFHGNLLICQLISHELKFKISKCSELSLRRYLQNNTNVFQSLIFLYFSCFSNYTPLKPSKMDNHWIIRIFFGNVSSQQKQNFFGT